MVKCSNCGLEISGDLKYCPNCGSSSINSVEDDSEDADVVITCENCGSQLSETAVFCSVCGSEVNHVKKEDNVKICPNCGNKVDENSTFCDECGSNVFTGDKNKNEVTSNNSFLDRINLNLIIRPTIFALVISVILSVIGLLIGFTWFSFVIAIILSAGFFSGLIDDEANVAVFGFLTGLILGVLENPLVEFVYGAFAAGFYDGLYGGHLLLLIILGVVCAYVSNIYFKDSIRNFVGNFRGML